MSKWYPCIYCTEDLHCTKYSDDDSESWCVLGPCTAETPSNGDKIRRMTDEELADWFSIYCCRNKTYDAYCTTFGNCKDCWIDWLHEEARE